MGKLVEEAGLCFLAAALAVGCDGSTSVEFFRGEARALTSAEQATVEDAVKASVAEARKLLPGLPAHVKVRVHADHDVLPETGEAGTTAQPDTVIWTVNPDSSGGVETVVQRWLRAGILHELHHLVRDAKVERRRILDRAVSEGMATVFERDFAGVDPPWGQYPEDVCAWVREISSLPAHTAPRPWVARHPDGRRWVAQRAGTYLVERAMKTTGKSSAQLVLVPTEEIARYRCPRATAAPDDEK